MSEAADHVLWGKVCLEEPIDDTSCILASGLIETTSLKSLLPSLQFFKKGLHQELNEMASPTLDLLCCYFFDTANSTNMSKVYNQSHFELTTYFYLHNWTVISVSTFSVLGTLYLLFPRKRDTSNVESVRRPGVMEIRQRWILSWLSFADIMACLGLIVLSSTLVSGDSLTKKPISKSWRCFCIPVTTWIHFFFIATYVWITCYTVDVFLYLKKTTVKHILRVYLAVSWLLPIVLISFGLWALYSTTKPRMACSSATDYAEGLLTVYYLCLFIPMVLALVINPILYILAVKKVSPLVRARGMYTDREREVERQVKRKFLKIVIVLEVCWFPNVISDIMLLSRVPLTTTCFHILWILMAILNPLQAFLNTLVYWGPKGCSFLTHRPAPEDEDSLYLYSHAPWTNAAIPSDTETKPLLRGRTRDAVN